MLLGFKTELDLNNEQRTFAAKHAGTARHAWNWGLWLTQNILDHNPANPSEKLKFPSAIDLHKLLVAMVKPENPWYYETSKSSPQYALRQLREAWDRTFKKKAKPPQFKRKGRSQDSFTLDGTIKILGSNHIQVPKFGVLKTFESLPQVPVKNVTISRQSDKWFISFKIEIEPQSTEKTNLSVGVDLGVKHFATLSDGLVFDVPEEYKKLKAKIAKLQYLNRNKQRGSQAYKDFQKRIAGLHYRLTGIRKNYLHHLTTYLAKTFKVVCIEDLNVKGMLKFGKLAGAVAMLGFYEFRRQLEYKCKLYGSDLQIIGRWEPSSRTCSKCGWKDDELTLKNRVFNCQNCGHSIDRDLNAALNIERIGLSSSSLRLVDVEVPTPTDEVSNKHQSYSMSSFA
ncbi:MAG: transposase [Cyanobacteria bacterium CRU_2_1]|nr:transposase [Cyanobacteria bacterium CRU_2_1]